MNNSNPYLINVIIQNNLSWGIDNLSLYESNPYLINVSITTNTNEYSAIFGCRFSKPYMRNVTIYQHCLENQDCQMPLNIKYSTLNIVNSIFWTNTQINNWGYESEINITYSNIKPFENTNLIEGNINTDPQFTDPDQLGLSFFPSSPCINAGDPDLNKNSITWDSDSNDCDPDGTRMDMGANFDRNIEQGFPFYMEILAI